MRFYHHHASIVEAWWHYEEHPEAYKGMFMTQIREDFKVKGSVTHDVAAMPKGHPLRNVRFTGDTAFPKKNWNTLKFRLETLLKQDNDMEAPALVRELRGASCPGDVCRWESVYR